jgi:hypothetical protein
MTMSLDDKPTKIEVNAAYDFAERVMKEFSRQLAVEILNSCDREIVRLEAAREQALTEAD